MGDLKSKLPDLKELSSMTNKLFCGIKTAVNEIIHDYKEKRVVEETKAKEAPQEAAPAKEEVKAKKASTPEEKPSESDTTAASEKKDEKE